MSPINLTRRNITRNLEIRYNRISLNTRRMPELNLPAKLTLYNIHMVYPHLLRNYADCPDENCEFISYDGSTLVFNVTRFSSYSAEDRGRHLAPYILVFSFSIIAVFMLVVILKIAKKGDGLE
jgi:hypothetical protein